MYEVIGMLIYFMSFFVKICWLKEEKFILFKCIEKFVDIKFYILYWLFGVWVMDELLVLGIGLYNIMEYDWEFEVMEIVKLIFDFLLKVVLEIY